MSSQRNLKALDFTLAREDTQVETNLARELKPQCIVSIAGSGGRSLSLLQARPEKLYAVDLSLEQIYMTQLRQQTYLQLSYKEFLFFWGLPPHAEKRMGRKREKLFLSLQLGREARNFFMDIFSELEWESLMYEGDFEKRFEKFHQVVRMVLGKNFDQIFKFEDLQDQINYYRKDFPKSKWKLALGILSNSQVFSSFLFKKQNPSKNIPDSLFSFYRKTFEQLFLSAPARENFFLQLCFYGRVCYADGLPYDVQKKSFEQIKEQLSAPHQAFQSVHADIFEWVRSLGEEQIDFLSLSDIASYFKGELEREFLQKLRPFMRLGGLIVLRSYLHVPEMQMEGLEDVSHLYQRLIEADKVQMHRIQVLRRKV